MATNQDQDKRDVQQQLRGVTQQQNLRILSTEDHQAYPGTNLHEERDWQRQQLGRELQELDREIEASEGFQLYATGLASGQRDRRPCVRARRSLGG